MGRCHIGLRGVECVDLRDDAAEFADRPGGRLIESRELGDGFLDLIVAARRDVREDRLVGLRRRIPGADEGQRYQPVGNSLLRPRRGTDRRNLR